MSNSIPLSAVTKFFSYLTDHLPYRRTKHKTLLGPAAVMTSLLYMLVLGYRGYGRALIEMKRTFARQLLWSELDNPSTSALCQARRKLSFDSMMGVFYGLIDECTHAKRRPSFTYAGKRVVSADGSDVVLPCGKKLLRYFGSPSNQHGPGKVPQAGLVLLWDSGRAMPLDFRVTTCKPNERSEVLGMLDRLGPGDLLLADRGFPSREVFFALAQKGVDFLIRMPRNGFTEVDDFIASSDTDRLITLDPKDPKGKVHGKKPLRLRLIKKPWSDGQVRVLVTTLCGREHNADELNELYGKRWNIETGFHELKVWHGLERLHARNPEGIIQEITALMIFMVFMAELEAMTRETYAEELAEIAKNAQKSDERPKKKKPSVFHRLESLPVRFNRLMIADIVVYLLVDCMSGNLEQARAQFRDGLRTVWRYRTKPRPNRSFSRIPKSPNAKQLKVWARKAKNA